MAAMKSRRSVGIGAGRGAPPPPANKPLPRLAAMQMHAMRRPPRDASADKSASSVWAASGILVAGGRRGRVRAGEQQAHHERGGGRRSGAA
jgi:hypothetical protein